MNKIVFITGTDTGVGKTLCTALLLQHLRQSHINALAMKPFCSGGREDVNFLQALQKGELSDQEANPFYFDAPVAPIVGRPKGFSKFDLSDVLEKIFAVKQRCDLLLIEGAGGLLVPLAENFFVVDLISALNCKVILVARNQLGTLNHTLLSMEALHTRGLREIEVILMNQRHSDPSSQKNEQVLQSILPQTRIFSLPFLGENLNEMKVFEKNSKKVKKILAKIRVDT